MNIVAQHTEVMRPLRELVPLIKEDLRHGKEAAKSAGMPYFKAAGEKMVEAKPQVKNFRQWIKDNFGISPTEAQNYMALARHANTTLGKQKPNATLREFLRATGRDKQPTGGYVHRVWRKDVDDIAERARRDMERIAQEDLTRKQEREAEAKLALRLIDIGYKVLAKELHPDKGGSRDAMQRLGRVRDRLKASA